MKQVDPLWLDEPASRHPLADIDRLKDLLDRLPAGDSLSVLRKVTGLVDEIAGIDDLPLQQQFDVLDVLDRFAKDHQLNLVPEYLDAPRMRKLSESQLWTTSFEFWKVIGNAYLHCLERFQAAGDAEKDFQHNLPRVVCRVLRSLTLQLKWTQLRYARIEERIWRDLGRAYLFASSRGFSTRNSPVYPGSHGESNAQEELLKALMFVVSAPDGLSPAQQHIAERIVAYLGQRFALHTTPGPGCLFSFDLSMYLPPARVRKGAMPAPLLRFFGPGTATESLHELLDHLLERGTLPVDTPLHGNFSRQDIEVVLDHLRRCWSASPITRRGKRRDLVTRLTVVPRLNESVRWLADLLETPDGDTLVPNSSESWVVVDASDGGYGAVVASRPGDWLEIGALAGLRGEAAPECRMGILRRISADVYDQQHVGLQLIGEVAVPVALFAASAKNTDNPAHHGEPAILISRRPDSQGAIELLLPPGSFMHSKRLQMRFRNRLNKIEFLHSIEKTRDFHWASFRLILGD